MRSMIESCRMDDGGLQTSVQELRRPSDPDSPRIVLVSCVHLAEAQYYAELSDVVGKLERNGATVYMEGVREASAGPITDMDLKRSIDAQAAALTIQYVKLPELFELPWVFQGSPESAIFPYPDTWKSGDVPAESVCLLMGPENSTMVGPLAAKYEEFKRLKATRGARSIKFDIVRGSFWKGYVQAARDDTPFRTRMLMRLMIACMRMVGKRPYLKPEWLVRIMYDHREMTAAVAALRDGGDVVLLWHPGHMRGIAAVLARNGYVPDKPSMWLHATHKVPSLLEKAGKNAQTVP